MPDAPVKSPQQGPKLMIRQGKKVTEGVPVPSVFANIKQGKLKPSHEFSMDGENWRRLDQHPQLARLFAQVKQQAPAGKKSGKGGVFFLILLLAIAGAAGYFHPHWAFFNVQTAAEYNNKMKVEQWVQKTSLAQSITSQVNVIYNEVSAKKIAGTPNERKIQVAARAQVDLLLKNMFTTEAVIAYTKGQVNLAIPDKAAPQPVSPPVNDPFATLGWDLDYWTRLVDKVQVVLDRADVQYADLNTVTATIKSSGGKDIQFKYIRHEFVDWKLVGVQLSPDSIRTALEGIVESAIQKSGRGKKTKKGKNDKEPEVARGANPVKSYIQKSISVGSLKVGQGKKYQFGSPNPGVFATLHNKGNQTLNEVEVTVYFFNKKGAIVSEKKLYPISTTKYRPGRDNDPLKPKSEKNIGYLVKDFAPKSWAGKITLKVTDIKFKNS